MWNVSTDVREPRTSTGSSLRWLVFALHQSMKNSCFGVQLLVPEDKNEGLTNCGFKHVTTLPMFSLLFLLIHYS